MGIYPSPLRSRAQHHTQALATRCANPLDHTSSLDKVSLHKLGKQGLAQGSRAALHRDTGILQSGNLRVRTALTTADDGTGVTHTTTRRGTDTGDEADGGLVVLVVGLEELGGVLFGTTTNLTNHDDTLGLGVVEEDAKAVDEVGTGEGVTTDTDDKGLSKASLGGLVHSLVSQSTGARDDTNATALVDKSRHDTDLALALNRQ